MLMIAPQGLEIGKYYCKNTTETAISFSFPDLYFLKSTFHLLFIKVKIVNSFIVAQPYINQSNASIHWLNKYIFIKIPRSFKLK